jgi:hypothetical protein
MQTHSIQQWASRLEALARPVLESTPLFAGRSMTTQTLAWIEEFADEMGHRRAIDRALLARLTGTVPGPKPESNAMDTSLWWGEGDALTGRCDSSPKPVTPLDPQIGIEIWTEAELASLHAVWNDVVDGTRPSWSGLARSAVDWHLDELQPDNATGHAFALHGFVICAHESGRAEAWLHADMIVHGCMLGRGMPDRFSACLMLDAARGLQKYLAQR